MRASASFQRRRLQRAVESARRPLARSVSLESLESRTMLTTTITHLDTTGAEAFVNTAFFRQFSSGSGTGLIDSFVRIQDKNDADEIEDGFNTDATPELETDGGAFTRSLPLNKVPTVVLGGVTYREFVLDTNENDNALSLDEVRFYVSNSNTLSGYDAGTGKLGGIAPIFDLDSAGDQSIALNDGLSSGSGKGDAIMLIPDSLFPANNPFDPDADDVAPYVYMYSKFGLVDTVDGGFEEWAVGHSTPVLASIGGQKFNDLDGDGVRDANEPGLNGFTVNLLDDNGDPVLVNGNPVTQVTHDVDLNHDNSIDPLTERGLYSFDALIAGKYQVNETTQAGWTQTFPKSPNPTTYSITLAPGAVITGKDFGNTAAGSISGIKFNDLDGDGTQDAGEPTLENWTIVLNKGEADEQTTTTNSSGEYEFLGLAPGSYTVDEQLQDGWEQTGPASGTYTVTLDSNNSFTSTDNDFANRGVGEISGIKFNDRDGNGSQDSGEEALSDWTIVLNKGEADEQTTTTDSSGAYTFEHLAPGSYTVDEELQSGWEQTAPAGGTFNPTLDVNDSFASSGNDFGNRGTGVISGIKFYDRNGNGSQDSGEEALSDWTIILNKGDSDEQTTTTDSNGAYKFEHLGPGSYTVDEQLKGGWEQTAPSGGTFNPTLDDKDDFTSEDNDFGNRGAGSISGVKFKDSNANGVKDAGDLGLPNWVIILNDNGNGTVDNGEVTATTDSTGAYTFGHLLPGTYTLTEVQQTGWVQTAPATGTYSGVVLNSGNGFAVTGKDFGNFQKIAIGGKKVRDLTGNGYTADDVAFSGVTIQLYKDGNNNGILDAFDGAAIDSKVTNAQGLYSFTGLGPGKYFVKEVVPTGYVQTTPTSNGYYTNVAASGTDVTDDNFANFATNRGGGGHTLGFWSNNNGEAIINDNGGAATELTLLSSYNLKDAKGNDFNPTTYKQLHDWLLAGTATNMAYMLSVQLATMVLNVEAGSNHTGFVSGGAMLYAPQLLPFAATVGPSLSALGVISVNDLITAANKELGLAPVGANKHSYTLSGNPFRAYQNALEIVLDNANNNLNFL